MRATQIDDKQYILDGGRALHPEGASMFPVETFPLRNLIVTHRHAISSAIPQRRSQLTKPGYGASTFPHSRATS